MKPFHHIFRFILIIIGITAASINATAANMSFQKPVKPVRVPVAVEKDINELFRFKITYYKLFPQSTTKGIIYSYQYKVEIEPAVDVETLKEALKFKDFVSFCFSFITPNGRVYNPASGVRQLIATDYKSFHNYDFYYGKPVTATLFFYCGYSRHPQNIAAIGVTSKEWKYIKDPVDWVWYTATGKEVNAANSSATTSSTAKTADGLTKKQMNDLACNHLKGPVHTVTLKNPSIDWKNYTYTFLADGRLLSLKNDQGHIYKYTYIDSNTYRYDSTKWRITYGKDSRKNSCMDCNWGTTYNEYKFNTEGQLTQHTYFGANSKNTYEYFYTASSFLPQSMKDEYIGEGDHELRIEKYDYLAFDKYGNWTKRKVFSNFYPYYPDSAEDLSPDADVITSEYIETRTFTYY